MAQENWQKYKLLKLLEPLRQETDEQNPLPQVRFATSLEIWAFRVSAGR